MKSKFFDLISRIGFALISYVLKRKPNSEDLNVIIFVRGGITMHFKSMEDCLKATKQFSEADTVEAKKQLCPDWDYVSPQDNQESNKEGGSKDDNKGSVK